LLVSEIARLLGVSNCVYYHCMMNGTGHLTEDLSLPARMCPVDLRKVFYATERVSEIVPFVTSLNKFYAKYGITDEEEWTKGILSRMKKTSKSKSSAADEED
jgi:archaemetzincin